MTDIGPKPRDAMHPTDLELLKGIASGGGRPRVVLVVNKIDLVKEKAALFPYLRACGEAYPFAEIIPISAKKRDGKDRLVEVLRGMATEGPKLFDDETLSDRPTRFFVAEFVREQLLRKTREEVPHGVAVVVERFDEALKGCPTSSSTSWSTRSRTRRSSSVSAGRSSRRSARKRGRRSSRCWASRCT